MVEQGFHSHMIYPVGNPVIQTKTWVSIHIKSPGRITSAIPPGCPPDLPMNKSVLTSLKLVSKILKSEESSSLPYLKSAFNISEYEEHQVSQLSNYRSSQYSKMRGTSDSDVTVSWTYIIFTRSAKIHQRSHSSTIIHPHFNLSCQLLGYSPS